MTTVRTFQVLVVASLVLHMVWFSFPYMPIEHSSEVAKLVSFSGYGASSFLQHPLFYFSVLVAKLFAAIGLFFFLSWGRWLFVGILALSLGATPFGGVSVIPPMDGFVGALSALTDGAITALAFSAPIATYWREDV